MHHKEFHEESLIAELNNFIKHFKIDSNFYTIDVNFEFDSSNTVLIEIGDGQVSGLDYRFNATNPEDKFYTLFKEMVNA